MDLLCEMAGLAPVLHGHWARVSVHRWLGFEPAKSHVFCYDRHQRCDLALSSRYRVIRVGGSLQELEQV